MPIVVKSFISILLVIFFFLVFYKIALGINEGAPAMFDDGGELKCAIAVNTPLAPGIYDKIFVDNSTSPPAPEAFSLDAHMTDQISSHKFYNSKSPYKAGIDYNLNPITHQPYEDLLGEMPLVASTPNNDERDVAKLDTTECIEYRTQNKERVCVKYAEDLDPGDKVDSWNIEGTNFQFGYLGHTSIRIYQNDGQATLNQNGMICLKDIDVVPSYNLTVNVIQPLALGNQVIITGVAQDHTKPSANALVTITIGARSVSTSTGVDGIYTYSSDNTQVWGLNSGQTYTISAQTHINGKLITSTGNFGVNIAPPESTIQKTTGTNPKVKIFRYYYAPQNSTSPPADYWTSSSLQIPGPASGSGGGYTQDQPQGELFGNDDGSGPLTALFDCIIGSNHFNSIYQSNCPQYSLIGYIYSPTSIKPNGTHPLYQCKNSITGDERISLNNDCKNDPKDPDPYVLESVLGYALDQQSNCTTQPVQNYQVTSPVDLHQYYVDTVGKAVVDPGVNKQAETNSNIAEIPSTGVAKSFLNLVACTVPSLIGVTNFCPQSVNLGPKGTNAFLNKGELFNGSYRYPGIPATATVPLGNTSVISDQDPNCDRGNYDVGKATNDYGFTKGNMYSMDIPDSITTQGSTTIVKGPNDQSVLGATTTPPTTFQLKGYTNPSTALYVNGNKIPNDNRVEQYDCNQLLQFQSVYYGTSNGYRPPRFKDLICPGALAAPPATTLITP